MEKENRQKMSAPTKARLTIGGAFILALLCTVNFLLHLGIFGTAAKAVMLLSFVIAFVAVRFNISSLSEERVADKTQAHHAGVGEAASRPKLFVERPFATIFVMAFCFGFPILIWRMKWIALEWHTLAIVEVLIAVAIIRIWRMRRRVDADNAN